MRRRGLLKVAGAGVAALAAPRIPRTDRPNKLVFVPTGRPGTPAYRIMR